MCTCRQWPQPCTDLKANRQVWTSASKRCMHIYGIVDKGFWSCCRGWLLTLLFIVRKPFLIVRNKRVYSKQVFKLNEMFAGSLFYVHLAVQGCTGGFKRASCSMIRRHPVLTLSLTPVILADIMYWNDFFMHFCCVLTKFISPLFFNGVMCASYLPNLV